MISLTVTDEVGATCTAFIDYTVGTPPEVTITAPTTGDIASAGTPLTFSSTVADGQDLPDEVVLSWDLDGTEFSTQSATTTGEATFSDSTLAFGDYTLTVKGDGNHTGTYEFLIEAFASPHFDIVVDEVVAGAIE